MAEWISVDDRLPENSTDVLVAYSRTEDVSIGYYSKAGYWTDYVYDFEEKVAYWMPLPEAPKRDF